MPEKELSVNDAVEVVNGLFKGTRGFVEDIHKESSVVRIRDWEGTIAFALKDDVRLTT
jgi:transcription antitermination factor NusG